MWLVPISAATFSDDDWMGLNSGIPGTDDRVWATAVDEAGALYLGGEFNFAGTLPAKSVAKWDGTSWYAFNEWPIFGYSWDWVRAVAVCGTNLYAAGYLADGGGTGAYCVARWDGSVWRTIGWFSSDVLALAASDDTLFAGGSFTSVDGVFANYIAKWDGVVWSALGSGLGGHIVRG